MRRTRHILLVLAVAALLGAGCSGPSETTSDGPFAGSTTGSSPAAPAPDPSGAGPAPTTGEAPRTLRFRARTVAGEPFDATSLAGKPVALWFWAAWCPRCNAAADDVKTTQARFVGRAHVVGVAGLGSGAAPMRDFVAKHDIDGFPHLADDDGAVYRAFGVTAQDTYAVLDASGKVVYKGPMTAGQLRERLQALAG